LWRNTADAPAESRAGFPLDYPEAELLLLHRGAGRERRGRIWLLPVEQFLKNLFPARKQIVLGD